MATWRTIPLFLLSISTAILAFAGVASASAALHVSVVAPAPVPAGTEAPVTIRVEGPQADLATLDFRADGAQITGLVSLNLVEPGVAEGAVWLRRETPGDAVLHVSSAGFEVASGIVRFAAEGRLTARVTLAADAHASARTWRFEVLDASGALVATLSAGTSGAAPTGEAATAALPYGTYTVRQVLGSDTATTCSAGKFYRVAAEATVVDLASSGALVHFTITPCESAPRSLSVSIPVDTVNPEQPIDQVRGARAEGTPLPPATGTGTLAETQQGGWNPLLLLAFIPLVLGVVPGWRLVTQTQA